MENKVESARIFIVEDDSIIKKGLELCLTELGYRLAGTASTGLDAIQQACASRPDLILMDIRLAGDIDGIEAASRIRVNIDAPIVFITAYGDEQSLERAQVTSPFGYLLKPFDPLSLHAAIEIALQRKRHEQQLLKSEMLYRAVMEQSAEGIYIYDLEDRKVLEANSKFLSTIGYSLKELQTLTIYDFIAEDRSKIDAYIEATQREIMVAPQEGTFRRKDGRIVPVEVSARLIEIVDRKAVCVSVRDIEISSLTRFRYNRLTETLLSLTTDAIENINRLVAMCGQVFDAATAIYNRLQDNALIIIGGWQVPADFLPRDEPAGSILYDNFTKAGKDVFVVKDILNSTYADSDLSVRRFNLRTYLGKTVEFAGQSIGLFSMVFQTDLDISEADKHFIEIVASAIAMEEERDQADQLLRLTEERFKRLTDNIQDGIAIIENDKVVYINDRLCEITGYSREELVDLHLLDLAPGESSDHGGKVTGPGWTDPAQFSGLWLQRKDGKKRYVESRHSVLREGDKIVSRYIVTSDVTDQKRANQALEMNEARYRAIVEDQTDLICRFSPEDLCLTFVNSAYARFFNQSRSTLLTQVFLSNANIQNRSQCIQRINQITPHEGLVTFECRMHITDQVPTRWVFWTVRGVYDQQEHLVELQAVGQDITDRKNAENSLQRRVDQLSTIHVVSQEIVKAGLDADRVYQAIHRAVGKLMPCEAFVISWLSESSNEIDVVYIIDKSGRLPPKRIESGSGISDYVLRSGKSLFINHYDPDNDIYQSIHYGDPDSVRSVLAAPMHLGNRIIGMLSAQSYQTDAYEAEDLQLLELMSNYAAIALENARLYEQTSQSLHRLSALHTIDIAVASSLDLQVTLNIILDQTITLMGSDAADILLLNPYTQMLEYAYGRGFKTRSLEKSRIRLGQPLAGQAALERQTFTVTDISKVSASPTFMQTLSEENIIAYSASPMIAKGQVKGVLEIYHRITPRYGSDWKNFLETLAGQAAIAIDNASLFNEIQRSNVELTLAYDTTLEGWSRTLDLHNREIPGSTVKITEQAVQLARCMGISDEEIVRLHRGALLHDVGKVLIPAEILLKPGPLTAKEMLVMQKHPINACEILAKIQFLGSALDIPHYHHEKWDGSGYPDGLKGEQIPITVRIFAIIDVWDALTSDRTFRKAWSEEQALAYIREQSEKHFDPLVVDAFFMNEIWKIGTTE